MRLFSITNVGFATGLVVPRAGEVVRPYLVARHHALADLRRLRVDHPGAAVRPHRGPGAVRVVSLPAAAARGAAVRRNRRRAADRRSAGRTGGPRRAGHALLADLLARPSAARCSTACSRGCRGRSERRCRGRSTPSRPGLGVLRASPAHLAAIAGQSRAGLAADRAGAPLEQPRVRDRAALPHRLPDARVPDGGGGRADARHGGRLPLRLPGRAHRRLRRGRADGGGRGPRRATRSPTCPCWCWASSSSGGKALSWGGVAPLRPRRRITGHRSAEPRRGASEP